MRTRDRRWTPGAGLTLPALLLLWPVAPARGANSLTVLGSPVLDRPTPTALGVQLLIADDDDRDASVRVRHRQQGQTTWRDAMPLFRVRPEHVTGLGVPAQFAGSVLFLRPATSYELELQVYDPDGPADQILVVTATTRALPADPPTPTVIGVSSAGELRAALAAAAPGHVIELGDGAYMGTFALDQGGSAGNPIVIRGHSQDGVILDGGGASGNVLEVYGSFVHVERLTIQNANRALRFQSAGARGNVVRRVRIRDVTLGIGSREGQEDFYICDNQLTGRLSWPLVYSDDGGAHANDDGINLAGDGHVVCHNLLVGFGDALKIEQDGSRAVDFYGNEVSSAYDNGLELDTLAGNGRAFFNRFTNNYMPISAQPVHGGPVYCLRNVAVNVVGEQLKLHNATSGVLVFHNTFVSPGQPLVVWDDSTSHHFALENNLFIGPTDLGGRRTVEWDGTVDDGTFDFNGYRPDGAFRIAFASGTLSTTSFAALQSAGVEVHGLVMASSPFASGLEPPVSASQTLAPQDVTLAAGSAPVDQGRRLPNFNDGYQGTGPDLGALERGCPLPIFGVRPEGVDERTQSWGCAPGAPVSDSGVADVAAAADAQPGDAATNVDSRTGDAAVALDAAPGTDAATADDTGVWMDATSAHDVAAAGADAAASSVDAGQGAQVAAGCACAAGGPRPSLFVFGLAIAIACRHRQRGPVSR